MPMPRRTTGGGFKETRNIHLDNTTIVFNNNPVLTICPIRQTKASAGIGISGIPIGIYLSRYYCTCFISQVRQWLDNLYRICYNIPEFFIDMLVMEYKRL